MRAYVGQARGRSLIARLRTLGLGESTCRGELPPRRDPWFYDNGAFPDWKAGRAFDGAAFCADVTRISMWDWRPDFLVVPDIVAGGMESLRFSLRWLPQLRGLAPLYLAVQDGMQPARLRPVFYAFDGVFLGGTLPWKVATGEAWVHEAHAAGRPLHVGRCGTARRVRWAHDIGADSLDSCLPLWSEGNLRIFTRAMDSGARQDSLPGVT